MFQKLTPNGKSSASNIDASNNPNFVPLPATVINLAPDTTAPALKGSPVLGTRPIVRQSVEWASNLFKPSRTKPPISNLKLGPSGAIVFQSQESLASTLVPASAVLSEHVGNAFVTPIEPTLVREKHKSTGQLRSSSPEKSTSVPISLPRRRSSENYQPRLSNFLGRHPPPIQRRSTSLPPTPLSRIPERLCAPTPERELLFIGGHTEPPSPLYSKIPRFVPLEIRRKNVIKPQCTADCLCLVGKEGEFCPEYEDQFSITGTHGSMIYSSFGGHDPSRCRKPTTTVDEEASDLGLMAKFKGILGKQRKQSRDERAKAADQKSKH